MVGKVAIDADTICESPICYLSHGGCLTSHDERAEDWRGSSRGKRHDFGHCGWWARSYDRCIGDQ